MKRWVRWQDWVTGVAGLYTAFATLWTHQAGASRPLMTILGLLLAAAAAVNLAAPGKPWAEWGQLAVAVLLFIAPWIGGYANLTGAAWTSWIAGLVAAVVTAVALKPTIEAHRHTPSLSH